MKRSYSHSVTILQRAATWAGWPLSDAQLSLLHRMEEWLREEAIPSGSLGPNEGTRLLARHIGDSLLFAAGWRGESPPPRVADLGSGAGLPGLPLAVLWPESAFTLVERRRSRAELIERGVRTLQLENVDVVKADAARVDLQVELVVARAAAAPSRVAELARPWLVEGGSLVAGGSWMAAPDAGPGEEVLAVPAEVLDRPVWLRIMAAS